jgi:hypothetical protein
MMKMMKKQSSARSNSNWSNWQKVANNSITSQEAEQEHLEKFSVTKARPSVYIN